MCVIGIFLFYYQYIYIDILIYNKSNKNTPT